MRQEIVVLIIWSLSLAAFGIDGVNAGQSRYLYGVRGHDFGVVTSEDLAINACDVDVVPFSENSMAYPYWQCFETAQARLFCDGNDYDPSEKKRLSVLVVSGALSGEHHEYLSRRAIPLSTCLVFKNDWKRLTKAERYVCISGPFSGRKQEAPGKWVYYWTFDKFKTRRGCDPFFVGGCSLQYQLQHGCTLPEDG